MSILRQLTRGVRVLVSRDAADRDVADEVRHYADEAAADLIARGVPPEQARRSVQMEIGNVTVVREQLRSAGWENVITTFVGDLRYGVRRLAATPGFTTVCAATLALGIGATTAIFSAVYPIVIAPLPYPGAQRLVSIADYGVDSSPVDVTFGTFREISERTKTFASLAVMRPWQPTLVGPTEPERLDGQRVTADFFRVLGIRPALGRDFESIEDRVNGPRVVVLSHGLWQRRFGGDPQIVGRQLMLNDIGYMVVGVMPAGFENVLSPAAEIWATLNYDVSLPPDGREWGHHLRMIGRLSEGVSVGGGRNELDAISKAPIAEFHRAPWAALGRGLIVTPLQDDITAGVRRGLFAIVGAVFLVLLIACVNVTNLLLARSAQRRGELAMRAALGASRSRLVRQLLAESLLIAAIGGVLGLIVARAGVSALVALSPAGLPRADAIAVNAPAFVFAVAVAAIVGVLIGLVPAMAASREDLRDAVQQTSTRSAGGHQGTRRALVVAEVALALVLLVSGGLLFRSLERLFRVEPGFNAGHLITMQVQVSGAAYRDTQALNRFWNQILGAVRTVPGVATAGVTSQLPLSGDFEKYGVRFEAIPNADPNEDGSALRYAVSADYFETMGIPLRRGRYLNARDVASATRVAVLNESYARRKFPNVDPIGQRLRIGAVDGPWFVVVGVVGDVKHTSLAANVGDAAYTTFEQWTFADNPMSVVVRAHVDPATLALAIKQAIWSVDRNQPVIRVATMQAVVERTAAERRFALILFEAFGLVALALAAIGIYGVSSGSVTERTREIGVRTALGASRRDIITLIVGQGVLLAGAGVVLGLLGATGATRALTTMLFGVSPFDPATYSAVVAGLIGIATIACAIPAWRASRIDPSITLRVE